MIRGLHGLFYSSDADATRAFMRDALKLPFTDVGGGWLIFDLPEGDVGVHPIEGNEPEANTHDVSFYCDDIEGTVADLRARGVAFKSEPADHGYGYVTYFTMPGGVEVQLYEPKYEKSAKKKAAKAKAPAKAPAKKKAKTPAKTPAKAPAKKKPAAKKRR
jgi:predicted enzyme related to lactoylglutathione lyase